ncbi:MAG: hypothetical protein HYV32_03295 [Candidatus Kerfeldbacteria bacterium]|nr:hypothetical protein [Candidatus Kerfeldbacteria bacterium]
MVDINKRIADILLIAVISAILAGVLTYIQPEGSSYLQRFLIGFAAITITLILSERSKKVRKKKRDTK